MVSLKQRPRLSSLAQMSVKMRRKIKYIGTFLKPPKPYPLLTDIDTIKKMGNYIRQHYGYGLYEIFFYNTRLRNKRFSKKFLCKAPNCGYYKNGSCKIWKVHTKGTPCKYNNKIRPNWTKRAELEIIQKQNENLDTTTDYEIKWVKSSDRMHYLRWFWKGNL